MKSSIKALLAATGFAALALSPANAFEAIEASTKSGAFIGASAGVPPPGIYMFNQVFTYQANFTGPGTTSLGLGNHSSVHANDYTMGFLFVPGWTFLGATYDAVLVQPFVDVGLGTPNGNPFVPPGTTSGVFNTYIVPVELSWKLGTSGFAVKTGLGIYAPTGTETGANKLGNVGNPWWTFQPELIISYLANGWNLSAAIYEEFNTQNRVTHYTSGDTFHVDFTATKTFGKWTVGPVGYYTAQVTDDKCPVIVCAGTPFNPLGTAGHTQRFHVFALGGLVEYNFGPASLTVWATQELTAKASNTAALATIGEDLSLATKGLTVFSTLSFALWNPEAPAKAPMIHK